MSEFNYFTPTVLQSSITKEQDVELSTVNVIGPGGNALGPFEFKIPSSTGLYRDLNSSYIVLKIKVVAANGADLAADVVLAPSNLALHSLFSNVSVTLGGKEISDKDSLYAYRAYLETLLTYQDDVLKTRAIAEGWSKDSAGRMNNLQLLAADGQPVPNDGFVARQKLLAGSRTFTLLGRPHVDIFHQELDVPPNVEINITFTPSTTAFAFIGANANANVKVMVMDAKLYVHTKTVCADLVLAHREMPEKCPMRPPLNRVLVKKHGIGQGFTSSSITLNFPGKLPKRIFVGFVLNAASTGTITENPFNFQNFGLTSIQLTVNGDAMPAAGGLKMDYATGDYQRAYLSTLAALGLENGNRSIDLTPSDFASGFNIYGFKVAPGPIDGTVFTAANSVGSAAIDVTFAAGLVAPIDMIVYAEMPAILEIDKFSGVTIV